LFCNVADVAFFRPNEREHRCPLLIYVSGPLASIDDLINFELALNRNLWTVFFMIAAVIGTGRLTVMVLYYGPYFWIVRACSIPHLPQTHSLAIFFCVEVSDARYIGPIECAGAGQRLFFRQVNPFCSAINIMEPALIQFSRTAP